MKTLKISDDVHQKLTAEVEDFIEKHKRKGYTRKEEFIRQAIRFLLKWESEEYEYIEIPREKYERLNQALKEMNTPFYSVDDFINHQIEEVLERYDKWLGEKEE